MTAALVKKDLLKEADDLRRLLDELAKRAATDLESLVDRLLANGASVAEVRDVVTAVFPDVAQRYSGLAATATADWYDDLGPDGPSSSAPDPDRFMPSIPDIAEVLPEARLLGTASWAINNIADGVFDEARRQRLLSDLTGASTRAVFDGSRETVSRNAIAENVKLRRVAQPTACLFCATLATRGAVYLTVASATDNSLGKKYHDHCKCVVVPERDGTFFTEPEYYEMFELRYIEAKKAVGPHSQFKDDDDPNAYFKAILAEMRKQEAALPKVFDGEDLTPAWDQSGWSDERKALRLALDKASTLEDLEVAAQKLLDAGPSSPQQRQPGYNRFPPRVVLTRATAQSMAHPLLKDTPGVTPTPLVLENVRGAIRAVDDFQHRYPGIYLDGITFHDDVDTTFAATWRVSPYGWNEGSSKINMNARWINSAGDNVRHLATLTGKTFDAEFDATVDVGYHYRRDGGKGSPTDRSGPTGQPSSYAVMMHELGHGMANNTNAGGKYRDPRSAPPEVAGRIPGRADNPGNFVPGALADYYAKTRVGSEAWKKQDTHGGNTGWTGKQLTEFNEWCYANMSGYSFKPDSWSFNGPEAIAEAFADVEINGPYARETSKVLHRTLVDAYRGDTPYAGTARGILDADPDFMDWPDYRADSDAMHSPINYRNNKVAGQPVTGMSKRLDGVDASDAMPTSTRVEIPYVRNNNGMRDVAGFGQDAEPWGRYMAPAGDGEVNLQSGWERGTATLERPLYVDHNDGNWKAKLSAQYGGSTGQELTDKLLADGFDGVVTQDNRGIVEFVDVRPRAQRRFTVEESTSTWQQAGIPPLKRTSWEESEYAKLDDKRLSKDVRAEARALVDAAYDRARAAEPKITSTVMGILDGVGAEPHGLEYRLKDPPSLYRKVQTKYAKQQQGVDAAAVPVGMQDILDGMKDTVRYTAIVDVDGYWKSGSQVRDELIAAGATLIKDPKGIAYEGYRGRNLAFEMDGVKFELQIHTAQSMTVKDKCHKLYEVERLPGTSEAERVRLRDKQQRLWDTVTIDKGTPMLYTEDAGVWFTTSSKKNIGPTVPVLDRTSGEFVLPYGSHAAGMKHPPIPLMVKNAFSDDMAAWERLTDEEKEWGITWYKRLRWFLAEDSIGTRYEGDNRRQVAIYAALSPRTDFDINYAAVRKVLAMDPRELQKLDGLPGVIPDNFNRIKRILAVDDNGDWVVGDPVWALRGNSADDLFYKPASKSKKRMFLHTSLEEADRARIDGRLPGAGEVVLSDSSELNLAAALADGRAAADGVARETDPAASQGTQISTTGGTYLKAREVFDAVGAPGGFDPADTLDYGAGHGLSREEFGFSTYEPFPKTGRGHRLPDFSKSSDLPDGSFDRVVSLNVLNVVERADRDEIVKDIGRVMRPGGHAIITTRGRDVLDAKGGQPAKSGEPWAVRIKDPKTGDWRYQKGFKVEELRDYVAEVLGDGYTVESVSTVQDSRGNRVKDGKGKPYKLGEAAVIVRRTGAGPVSPRPEPRTPGGLVVVDIPRAKYHPKLGTWDVGIDADGNFHGVPGKLLEDGSISLSVDDIPAGWIVTPPRKGLPGAREHNRTAAPEDQYLELQRGPRDQWNLDAPKIYNHALNALDEEENWAVTVDTWDARIKLGVRDDNGEARRVLDGVVPGKSDANLDEKNEIYQEFAEAGRIATRLAREHDPEARDMAREYGYYDLSPKHFQAATWGPARRTRF